MKDIQVSINGGTGSVTHYVPAPCRGIVKSVKAVFNKAVANDDTVDIQRGSTSVNLITTGDTSAGKLYVGTPDATNKDLVFDPDSIVENNKAIKIVVSALASANTMVGIHIQYDESAAVTQPSV